MRMASDFTLFNMTVLFCDSLLLLLLNMVGSAGLREIDLHPM